MSNTEVRLLIEIGGQKLKLTPDEARSLYEQLDKIFSAEEAECVPVQEPVQDDQDLFKKIMDEWDKRQKTSPQIPPYTPSYPPYTPQWPDHTKWPDWNDYPWKPTITCNTGNTTLN